MPLARSGWGLPIRLPSLSHDGFGNDFLGPLVGRQVEALIMAFHQPLEAAGGTHTARLALKAKGDA